MAPTPDYDDSLDHSECGHAGGLDPAHCVHAKQDTSNRWLVEAFQRLQLEAQSHGMHIVAVDCAVDQLKYEDLIQFFDAKTNRETRIHIRRPR